jgi:hypothetical protein
MQDNFYFWKLRSIGFKILSWAAEQSKLPIFALLAALQGKSDRLGLPNKSQWVKFKVAAVGPIRKVCQ